jgi:5-methylcytosine-specific restriction endonuclease McrA
MIKHLDKIVSQVVRSRGKCERCGRTDKALFCAHIHPRTKYNTRFDLENLLSLCWHCHQWGHLNPIDFSEFVKDKLGQKKYDDLRIRANLSAKGQDLESIRLFLESKLA